MKPFREYSAPLQESLARQIKTQAGSDVRINYWLAGLRLANPVLPSYPAFPEATVGELVVLVDKLKPYNLVYGKPDDTGLYAVEIKHVSKAQAKRDFLAEHPLYKVHKVEDWYQ